MRWNFNNWISVRLTDEGRRLHRANHEALVGMMPASVREAMPYRPPAEDEDGWSKWQGWHLMQEFGPWMRLTVEPPFELTVEIHEKQN